MLHGTGQHGPQAVGGFFVDNVCAVEELVEAAAGGSQRQEGHKVPGVVVVGLHHMHDRAAEPDDACRTAEQHRRIGAEDLGKEPGTALLLGHGGELPGIVEDQAQRGQDGGQEVHSLKGATASISRCVPDYERKLRRTDLQYKSAAQYDSDPDKLQVYVTYKIQIKNQSVGKLTGYITDLNDYADSSYQLVNSYDENGRAINWSSSGTVSGSGKTYNKIHTTSLSGEGITDKKWIFMQYKVSYDTLRELLQQGETLEENYAEIAGYRNTYTEDRYDLNNNKITNAGAVAGLLDIDSTPDNMNPTTSSIQNFVAQSKTDAYQSLSGEEKSKRSMAVFEDDADVAPGLKLIRDDTERTISGTVFEDSPLKDKLKNNERIGDGEYKNGENIVNKVKVELLCQNNEDVDTLNKVETYSLFWQSNSTFTLFTIFSPFLYSPSPILSLFFNLSLSGESSNTVPDIVLSVSSLISFNPGATSASSSNTAILRLDFSSPLKLWYASVFDCATKFCILEVVGFILSGVESISNSPATAPAFVILLLFKSYLSSV